MGFLGRRGVCRRRLDPRADGWAIVTRGKLPSGKSTAAVNDLIRVDANTLAWQSCMRRFGGEPLQYDEIRLLRDAVGE